MSIRFSSALLGVGFSVFLLTGCTHQTGYTPAATAQQPQTNHALPALKSGDLEIAKKPSTGFEAVLSSGKSAFFGPNVRMDRRADYTSFKVRNGVTEFPSSSVQSVSKIADGVETMLVGSRTGVKPQVIETGGEDPSTCGTTVNCTCTISGCTSGGNCNAADLASCGSCWDCSSSALNSSDSSILCVQGISCGADPNTGQYSGTFAQIIIHGGADGPSDGQCMWNADTGEFQCFWGWDYLNDPGLIWPRPPQFFTSSYFWAYDPDTPADVQEIQDCAQHVTFPANHPQYLDFWAYHDVNNKFDGGVNTISSSMPTIKHEIHACSDQSQVAAFFYSGLFLTGAAINSGAVGPVDWYSL